MQRAIMTRKIDHESAPDSVGDSFVLEELLDIKQIAGMLAIQGRNQLAAINILRPATGAITSPVK